jgi:hypothetical protein
MRKLDKLRKISLDELRVRSSQAVATFAERHSLTGQTRLASNDHFLSLLDRSHFDGTALTFLDHFRSRKTPQFFASFGDPHATLRELRRCWPEVEEKMVAQADKILSGRFDLLGFKDLNFNDSSGSIDWHLEPVARKRAPLDHWSRLNYLDSETAGDKKIIW